MSKHTPAPKPLHTLRVGDIIYPCRDAVGNGAAVVSDRPYKVRTLLDYPQLVASGPFGNIIVSSWLRSCPKPPQTGRGSPEHL
jgi:hypothetical protein